MKRNLNITTKRLKLELISKSHIESVFKIYSSYSVCQYYDLEQYTERTEAEDHVTRWLNYYATGKQIRFAIVLSDIVIGTCGLYQINPHHRRAYLGYDLLPDYQGNGYALEAVEAMINQTRVQYDLHRIQAHVIPENISSVNLLEKMGFQNEGLLKQYEKWGDKGFVDLFMYAKLFPLSET